MGGASKEAMGDPDRPARGNISGVWSGNYSAGNADC